MPPVLLDLRVGLFGCLVALWGWGFARRRGGPAPLVFHSFLSQPLLLQHSPPEASTQRLPRGAARLRPVFLARAARFSWHAAGLTKHGPPSSLACLGLAVRVGRSSTSWLGRGDERVVDRKTDYDPGRVCLASWDQPGHKRTFDRRRCFRALVARVEVPVHPELTALLPGAAGYKLSFLPGARSFSRLTRLPGRGCAARGFPRTPPCRPKHYSASLSRTTVW